LIGQKPPRAAIVRKPEKTKRNQASGEFWVKPSRRRLLRCGIPALLACGVILCTVWAVARGGTPTAYDYEVVNVYPHDPEAYCQGLVFANGFLYEGTGQYGESTLRKVELETGKVLAAVALDRSSFGEGVTLLDGEIYQLTWKGQHGWIYDAETLTPKKHFRYAGQGWGLTHDGRHLIMSDGTSTLRFLDPKRNFRVERRITVRYQGRRIKNLNELEYVNGHILANVWYKDYILFISPQDGDVVAWADLKGILNPRLRVNREAVLNGIAYDQENDRLFVTGKNWPKLFEIRLTR
jgi:glutamine cyclotransferase